MCGPLDGCFCQPFFGAIWNSLFTLEQQYLYYLCLNNNLAESCTLHTWGTITNSTLTLTLSLIIVIIFSWPMAKKFLSLNGQAEQIQSKYISHLTFIQQNCLKLIEADW